MSNNSNHFSGSRSLSIEDFGQDYLIQVIDPESPYLNFIGIIYRVWQTRSRLRVRFKNFFYDFTPEQLKILNGGDITISQRCNSCGVALSRFHPSLFVDTNQIEFCHSCYTALYTACDCCRNPVLKEETVTDPNGITFCRTCHNHFSRVCAGCGNRFNDNMRGSTTDDAFYCVTCQRDYNICYSCRGVIVDPADERAEDDFFYCSRCFNRRSVLMGYDYKPNPRFHTATETEEPRPLLYLGVELEVDKGGYSEEHAREVKDILPFVYLKSDGSLNDGFEIVTHPCTLVFHEKQKEKYRKTFCYLVNNSYKSHDTDTCGLHVHVNRDFFGKYSEDQEQGEAKLLYLVETFWNELVNFSRRKPRELDEWAQRAEDYDPDDSMEENLDKAKGHGRYYALNFENRNTIEFRLFKGTLNLETFIGTLQLVDLLVRYARENTPEQLLNTSWKDLFLDIDQQYPELKSYLKKRYLL